MTLPRADPERPPKRLPAIPQRSIRTQKEADAPGSVPQHADDGHSVAYQRRSEKGQLGGYPELDDGGKVPPSQLGGGGADATKFLRGDQSWQVPAGGGGGGHTIRENGVDQPARTGLNFIDADAGAGLITDDAGGDETEVNLNLYPLLSAARAFTGNQVFNAGLQLAASQTIKDSGGTGRVLLATASPHLTLTGDAHVTGRMGVSSAPTTDRHLNVSPSGVAFSSGGANYLVAVNPAGCTITANNTQVYGVYGAPAFNLNASITGVSIFGLSYTAFAGQGSGATVASLRGILVGIGALLFSGTVTASAGIEIAGPFVLGGTPTITINRGLWVRGQGIASSTDSLGVDIDIVTAGTNRYGLRIADIAGGTIARILELGPATPHLRLEGTGNWAPGINTATSPLLLLMGNNDNPLTKTLRRVQWKDAGAGGANLAAGDKVLIAV